MTNRDRILELIDSNNKHISNLVWELKECYKLDKRFNNLLMSTPVELPESIETAIKLNDIARRDTEKWENEGGSSHAKMSPFTGRTPSFNEFAERLTHADIPPYKDNE